MLPAIAMAAPSRAFAKAPALEDQRLADVLLEVFAQPDTARLLGSAYLEKRPHEASFANLMAHLRADLDLPDWYRKGAGKADLHDRLQARAALDYGHDEAVEVAGCYLSVTELRLYALSACS